MSPLPRELENCFDRYQRMQAEHIHAITAHDKGMPDLAKQNFERARAFENLKAQLLPVLKQITEAAGDTSLPLILACQDKLAQIQKQDEALATHIQTYRDLLKRQKCHMVQGKRALRGYQKSVF